MPKSRSKLTTVRTLLGHFTKNTELISKAQKKPSNYNRNPQVIMGNNNPGKPPQINYNDSNPSPMIKNLGLELQQSVDKWEQLSKELEQLIPRKHTQIR